MGGQSPMKGVQRRREQLILDLRSLKKPGFLAQFSPAESHTVRRGWRYVSWAAKRNLDLPKPGSPEDDGFGNLIAVGEVPDESYDALCRYLAGRLEGLASQSSTLRFEREVGPGAWYRVFFFAPEAQLVLRYIHSRLADWGVWMDALSGFLDAYVPGDKGSFAAEVKGLFHDLADVFPRHADVEYDWSRYHSSFFTPLTEAALERPQSRQAWCEWLCRWLLHEWGRLKDQPTALGDLAALLLGPDDYCKVLAGTSPVQLIDLRLWNSILFSRLVELAPEGVAEVVSKWWHDRSFEGAEWTWSKIREWDRKREIKKLLPHLGPRVWEPLAMPLGLMIGLILESSVQPGVDSSPEIARQLDQFGLPGLTELPEAVRFQSRLWRDLQILAKYEKESYRRGTELLGLRTSLTETAVAHPAEWARALPWVLECSQHLDGLAEAITVTVMQESKEVAAAVETLASADTPGEVRDRARGLQALAHGLLDPGDRVRQDLLSFAARQLDGEVFAAQVLAAPSGTWLNSYDMEAFLRSCAGEAERRFREYFLTQGGIEEEAVTGRLLAELERAFGAARTRGLRASGMKHRLPTVKLVHRQVPKKQEKTYGCDVAFLVSVAGHRIQGAEAAEFVQVKKPVRNPKGGAFVDRWRVDVRQLEDVLLTSSSSVYWLLGARGEVLVVPAKVLWALAPVRPWLRVAHPGASFHLTYFKLRSAAIPLAQFLIDLLVGLWLGATHPRVLDFAKGNARATTPRFIVEVKVDLAGEEHG